MDNLANVKLCLLSSIPVTLWSFYRFLPTRLSEKGFEVHICSSSGPALVQFENEGVNTWSVPINRKITPWGDLRSIFKLIKLFRRERFEIVHAHTPKAGFLGMVAARLTGIRNRVYTCHGMPLETERGIKRWTLKTCEKISFGCATKVFVVSPSLLQKVRDYGICRSNKATVLLEGTACGIDLTRFTNTKALQRDAEKIRAGLDLSNNQILIGFIGRLVPDKGIGVLLKAFLALVSDHEDCHLIIIGDYEPLRGCLSEEELDLIENHAKITHVGFTNDIEQYYAAMDILVLPTRREGFPYTLLESGAMERSVIATKVTGCIDAVVDGVTGLLVNVDDVGDLHKSMLRLAKDPQLRNELGRQGRQRVVKSFDAERLIREHIRYYDAVSAKGTVDACAKHA